jgi:hypothetical protein
METSKQVEKVQQKEDEPLEVSYTLLREAKQVEKVQQKEDEPLEVSYTLLREAVAKSGAKSTL